jgi:hypothetical protein
MRKTSEKPLLTFIAAGVVNNTPVPASSATMDEPDVRQQMRLILALATVKMAGYRVSKPRKPKTFKRGKNRVGPTFVCEFADGEITRMSVSTSLEKLDWDRGTRLSQAAWEARWRARERKQQRPYWTLFVAPVPPAIVAAYFERDGSEKVDEFIYPDMKGTPWLKVVKRRSKDGKKYFPQYHLENGTWVKGKPLGPAIPYRLRALLTAPANATVEIAEGEKDALTLAKLGLITTTNPGGACKWVPELNKWFAGFARANIYEDNDEAGRKHAAKVAAELCGKSSPSTIYPSTATYRTGWRSARRRRTFSPALTRRRNSSRSKACALPMSRSRMLTGSGPTGLRAERSG